VTPCAGPGDRARQRQPRPRGRPGRQSGPTRGEYGDPLAALDYFTLAIRNYHDAGNTTLILNPLAALAALFDRLGRYEPAATIAGFAVNPFTAPQINTAIAHLREVLGDQIYESLAHKGETMTAAGHGDLRLRPNRPE
jgi:hypothetical protein